MINAAAGSLLRFPDYGQHPTGGAESYLKVCGWRIPQGVAGALGSPSAHWFPRATRHLPQQ